jgi:hypothetical protein
MWLSRKQYEKLQTELINLRVGIAQATNRQWPKEVPPDYRRGWQDALVEVWHQGRSRGPRPSTQARQQKVTHPAGGDLPSSPGVTE